MSLLKLQDDIIIRVRYGIGIQSQLKSRQNECVEINLISSMWDWTDYIDNNLFSGYPDFEVSTMHECFLSLLKASARRIEFLMYHAMHL